MSTPTASRRKVYRDIAPGVRVPFTEVSLSDSPTGEANAPVLLYDTSGPGSDPRVGLPTLRRHWILERGDVEEVLGRAVTPADNGGAGGTGAEAFVRTDDTVLRAKPGRTVTQLHYARQGQITPEMRFIAARENVAPEFVRDEVAAGRGGWGGGGGGGRPHHPPKRQHPRGGSPNYPGPQLPREGERQHRQLGRD